MRHRLFLSLLCPATSAILDFPFLLNHSSTNKKDEKLASFSLRTARQTIVPALLLFRLFRVKMCLKLKKHTLVEKPMMMNQEECDELIELAKKQKRQFLRTILLKKVVE